MVEGSCQGRGQGWAKLLAMALERSTAANLVNRCILKTPHSKEFGPGLAPALAGPLYYENTLTMACGLALGMRTLLFYSERPHAMPGALHRMVAP